MTGIPYKYLFVLFPYKPDSRSKFSVLLDRILSKSYYPERPDAMIFHLDGSQVSGSCHLYFQSCHIKSPDFASDSDVILSDQYVWGLFNKLVLTGDRTAYVTQDEVIMLGAADVSKLWVDLNRFIRGEIIESRIK